MRVLVRRSAAEYLVNTTDFPVAPRTEPLQEWLQWMAGRGLSTYLNDHPFPVDRATHPNEAAFRWHASEESGDIFRVGIFLDFVRRSGTTRAEGPHGGALHVRRAKRNRIDRRSWIMLPLLCRYSVRTDDWRYTA